MDAALFQQLQKKASYSGSGSSVATSTAFCMWAIVKRGPIYIASFYVAVTGSTHSNADFPGLIPSELAPSANQIWCWNTYNASNQSLYYSRLERNGDYTYMRRDVTSAGLISTSNTTGSEFASAQFIYLAK